MSQRLPTSTARSESAKHISAGCSGPQRSLQDDSDRRHSHRRLFLCAFQRLARQPAPGNPISESSVRFYPLVLTFPPTSKGFYQSNANPSCADDAGLARDLDGDWLDMVLCPACVFYADVTAD